MAAADEADETSKVWSCRYSGDCTESSGWHSPDSPCDERDSAAADAVAVVVADVDDDDGGYDCGGRMSSSLHSVADIRCLDLFKSKRNSVMIDL